MKFNRVLFAFIFLILSIPGFSTELFVDIAKTTLAGSWKAIEQNKNCPNNIQISFIKGQWPRVESDFGQRPFDPKEINSGDQFAPFMFSSSDPITDTNVHSTSLYYETEAILKFIDKAVLINSKNLQAILTKSISTTNYRTIKNGQELIFEQFNDQGSVENAIYRTCQYHKN
jgi:hypothetical protein